MNAEWFEALPEQCPPTVESIRALAPLIDAAVKQDYLCVVGGQKAISEAKDMFDVIKPLI